MWNFKLQTLSLFTSILLKVLQTSNLLPLFPPSTKINHSSPPKEGRRNKYFQDSNQKLCWKKKPPNDPNWPFKRERKEKKWRKIPTWWPMEGSNAWWPMEGSNIWWPMEGSNTWWPMEGSKAWWPLGGSNVWWPLEGSNV